MRKLLSLIPDSPLPPPTPRYELARIASFG
jgi:hypothetical protein